MDPTTMVTTISAVLGAIGVGYITFVSTRSDRRLAEFEKALLTQAEIRERVRSHEAAISELRSDSNEVRIVLADVREQLAFIRASIQNRS